MSNFVALDYADCAQTEEISIPLHTLERRPAVDPATQTTQTTPIIRKSIPSPPASQHQAPLPLRKQATRLLIPAPYESTAEVIPIISNATVAKVGADGELAVKKSVAEIMRGLFKQNRRATGAHPAAPPISSPSSMLVSPRHRRRMSADALHSTIVELKQGISISP
jgi:hypothetical protein